jgi:hypothetical protein
MERERGNGNKFDIKNCHRRGEERRTRRGKETKRREGKGHAI